VFALCRLVDTEFINQWVITGKNSSDYPLKGEVISHTIFGVISGERKKWLILGKEETKNLRFLRRWTANHSVWLKLSH
jgi:hypothetical protein